MSHRYRGALVAFVLLALLPPTFARGDSLAKGTIEYQPSFSFADNSFSGTGGLTGSTTTLDLQALMGYCISPMWEVNGSLLIQHNSTGGDFGSSSATGAGLSAGLGANFSTQSAMVPFVRLEAGFISHSGDGFPNAKTTGLIPQITGGVRWMVTNTSSVNFTLSYQHEINANGASDLDANNLLLGVGVSLFALP